MVASKMIEAAYGNACAKRQMRLPSFKETHLRETGLCASLSIRSDLRDGTDDAGEGCYQEIVAGIFPSSINASSGSRKRSWIRVMRALWMLGLHCLALTQIHQN